MSDTKKLEDTDAEFAQRLKNDIDALSPEAREFCREQLAAMDKPKEEPAPRYGDLSQAEFQKLLSKLT
jgi:hypothetical protein